LAAIFCNGSRAERGILQYLVDLAGCEAVFAETYISNREAKMQSPEGSRLRGFYFRFHPLMIGERGGENTSVELVIHYSDGEIVFSR
jgi:hypothetical protein